MPLDGAASTPCPECTESSRVFITFVYSVSAALLLVTIYRVFRSRCMLSRTFPFFSMRYTSREVNGSQNYQTQLTTAGLDSAAIISLPAVQFKKRGAAAAAAGDDEQQNCECAICLGGFREGEWLRLLPNCLHAFHVSCVDVWLRDNSNCPLCRTNVLDDQLPAPALEALPREEPRQETVRSLRVVQLRFLSYER